MTAKHTPGPWRGKATRGAIVADGDTGWDDAENVESYGGHLVCESVSSRNFDLILAAPDLLAALEEGRRAIGDHNAPSDCYATGPLTGDSFRDLIQCPACSFIAMYDAAIAKAKGGAL